jgi:hypothetical protein
MRGKSLGRLVLLTSALVLGAAGPVQATADYHWTYLDYDCELTADPGITGILTATGRMAEHGITGTSAMRIDFHLQSRVGGVWSTEGSKSNYLDAPEDGGNSALKARRAFDLGSDAGAVPHRIKFVFRWYEGEKGPITVAKRTVLFGPECPT